MFVRS